MAIKFNNVSYSNKLKDINCTFEKNKITFLIGSSGSGKTLMSYLMTGLILPDYGNITVLDNTIDSSVKDFSNIRRNIGYVFQDPSTSFFTTSVRKEIEFGLRKYEYKLDSIDNRVIKSLKIVGLPNDYLDISPFELSSGEKEKLAIAISLSLNPKILILDEPTIYLDDKSKNELVTLLKKLKDKYNKTIIIISNDMKFLNLLADNIIMIKKGKVILNITSNELLDNMEKIKKNGMESLKILDFINLVEKYKNIKLAKTMNIDKLVSEIKNVKQI